MNDYTRFIYFLKKHGLYNEEIFKYIEENTERFDQYHKELMLIRGIYYNFNEFDQLTGYKLCVPYIDNEKTAFLNIEPYIKAIHAYSKLGKRYKPNAEVEILVMYYEKLYLNEIKNREIENHLDNIISTIKNEETEKKYKIAIKAQEELQKYCEENNPNYKQIQVKAKKLSRKYKHKRP